MASQKRFLIIDHDQLSRKLLVEVLADIEGAEILEASSAEEGLALFRAEKNLSLVIVDPVEATSQEWEIVGQLKEAGPGVRIVVLSTYQTSEGVAQAMQMGADDFLFKPVELDELRCAVRLLTKEVSPRKGRRTSSRSIASNRMVVRNEGDGTFVEMLTPTDSPHVDRFERFVRRLLENVLTKDEFFSVRLALEETITNSIEWGNRNDQTKQLKLSYCLLPDRVVFRIEDQGEGFDPSAVPDPTINPQEHIERRRASGKRMGGWGVCLTQKAVDEMTYNKKGNVVVLTKYLKCAKRPAPQPNGDASVEAQSEPTQ